MLGLDQHLIFFMLRVRPFAHVHIYMCTAVGTAFIPIHIICLYEVCLCMCVCTVYYLFACM